ncbi:MAG: sugar ABC transporter ATP-binding protein [Alphaproteobacteria bacterium]
MTDTLTPNQLTLSGVSKTYGSIAALDDVSVTFEGGRIHALVGENGAGKSTLGKVMLGVETPDAGVLKWQGEEARFSTPAQANKLGLVGISQELSLMHDRSVLDNLSIGREKCIGPFIDHRATLRQAQQVMEQYDMTLDPRAMVGDLPVADQQRVEILRALNQEANLIVFDEPTARLEGGEARKLMSILRKLAEQGKAIVFISHFLEEVLSVADTVTILRNGQHVRTNPASEETRSSLVEGMTGAADQGQFPELPAVDENAEPLLVVSGATAAGAFEDISLTIRPGEIVGLSGLVGAGRSELAHAIYGAGRIDTGTIKLEGHELSGHSVSDAVARGMALVPESRREQGLFMNRSILENVSLPYLNRFMSWLGLNGRQEVEEVRACGENTTLKYGELSDMVSTLSGGNQQKVLFARATLGEPRLLIADEPTRGVDVGAKRGIYDLIVGLAKEGLGVLLISSEIEEILGLSHRVVVLSRGRVMTELSGDEINENAVMSAAFGAK